MKSVDEKTRVDESRILKKDENFQIDQFRCFYESPEIYERETNRITLLLEHYRIEFRQKCTCSKHL